MILDSFSVEDRKNDSAIQLVFDDSHINNNVSHSLESRLQGWPVGIIDATPFMLWLILSCDIVKVNELIASAQNSHDGFAADVNLVNFTSVGTDAPFRESSNFFATDKRQCAELSAQTAYQISALHNNISTPDV